MDWNTNENDNENLTNSNHHHHNHHHHHHHDEFSNLNTNNYDTNLNLNINQLSQLISLNANQDLMSADGINNTIELLNHHHHQHHHHHNHLTSSGNNNTNSHTNNSNSNTNINNLVKNHLEDTDDKSNALSTLLLMNKNDKLIDITLNNTDNNLFTIATTSEAVGTLFINDLLSTNTSLDNNNNNSINANNNQNNNNSNNNLQNQESHQSQALSSLTDKQVESSKKLQLNRFNYKCNYCLHLTKFKAHIIEHMRVEHKINLMQCPYTNCSKKFKDEWKLKRHLISNKEHIKIGSFKDLNDCIKQHVYVTPQKIGQFPCPLCQIDQMTGNILILNELDQQTSILNLINKNIDNSLYFDKYDELRDHIIKSHPNFNVDSYFVCKQCGQVFLNRYKLSCHQFNVHSGKRKKRNAKTQVQINGQTMSTGGVNQLINPNMLNQLVDTREKQTININISNGNDNISNIIDSVAKGFGSVQQATINTTNLIPKIDQAFAQRSSMINHVPERKYLCIVCTRKFKRVRDLQTHVHIMHKNINDEQKEQLRLEIEKTNLLMSSKMRKSNHEFKQAVTNSNIFVNQTVYDPNTKICFICNKVFRAVSNSQLLTTPGITNTFNLNKSFQRHLQLQHGINEKGERLIDCPVCEKSFFSKIQLERHMRTHQIWIEQQQQQQQDDKSDLLNNKSNDQTQIDKLTGLIIPEYRDKHSILYCHECVECSIYFKSIKVLTKHKKEVHNLKPVYKCANAPECMKQFDTIDLFLEHSKIHSQKNIICPKCKIKFNNKNNLRHHMKNIHYKTNLTRKSTTVLSRTNTSRKNAANSSASQIDMTNNQANSYSNSSNLIKLDHKQHLNLQQQFQQQQQQQQHIQQGQVQQINNKPEFVCPTCGQDFTSRNSLHNHLATHNTNDLKLFMCSFCNASFKTRKELSRHAGSHEFTKHKTCQECGETFKTSFHLKRHSLTRHSNIRPFKCNHCDMTFARKDKLKQHEAKHINHPLYKCNECSKGFYRKEHLKDHEISKHSKQYPFTCENCSKGFVHAKDLHRHIRVRHLGNGNINEQTNSKQSTITDKNEINSLSPTLIENTLVTTTPAIKQDNNSINNQKTKHLSKVQNFVLNTLNTTTTTTTTTTTAANNNNNNKTYNQAAVAATSGTTTANDFKSKKISSILKSNFYNNNNNNNNNTTNNNNNVNISSNNIISNNNSVNNNYNLTDRNQQLLQQHLPQQQQQQQQQTGMTQTPILLTNTGSLPINAIINTPKQISFDNTFIQNSDLKQTVLNPNNCQIFSVRLNDIIILDKINGLNKVNNSKLIKEHIVCTDQSLTNNFNHNNSNASNSNHHQQQTQQIIQVTNSENNINNMNNNQISNNTNNNNNNDQTKNESLPEKSKSSFLKSFKCNTCNKSFFYENHLNKHILNKHSMTATFSCSFCNKGFSSKSVAKTHVENSHVDFVCPVCFKSFKNKSQAQRHIDKVHQAQSQNQINQNGNLILDQNLKPIKQTKINAKIIELSPTNVNNNLNIEAINSNQILLSTANLNNNNIINNNNATNTPAGTILLQNFDNITNQNDPKTDQNNNNLNLVNFSFDRQQINYSNLNWSAISTPSGTSTSPISSSVSQSSIGSNNQQATANVYIISNNQQQNMLDSINNHANLNNQLNPTFFL